MQQRRPHPGGEAEGPAVGDVDAGVLSSPLAPADPVGDPSATEASREELAAGHRAVLTCEQLNQGSAVVGHRSRLAVPGPSRGPSSTGRPAPTTARPLRIAGDA